MNLTLLNNSHAGLNGSIGFNQEFTEILSPLAPPSKRANYFSLALTLVATFRAPDQLLKLPEAYPDQG
jgi:hypothetical protein